MISVGRVVGVFGLQGHLKIEPLTDFPERFKKGAVLTLRGEARKILEVHWFKTQVRVRFEGIANPETAEKFIGHLVQMPLESRPALKEKDAYYFSDLIGLRVVDQFGKEIGIIEDMMAGAAQDLIVVRGTLIPAVKEFVKQVDLQNGVVHLSLIDGMWPEEN